MMKMEEIKNLNAQALTLKVRELEKTLFEAKFYKATAGIEKPHNYRALKKDIARLKTAASELNRK